MKTEVCGNPLYCNKIHVCFWIIKTTPCISNFQLKEVVFTLKVDLLAQDNYDEPFIKQSCHSFIYPSVGSHLSVTGVTLTLCDASSQTIIRYICMSAVVCVCRFAVAICILIYM